jgi:hypothetical protein
MVDDNRDLDEKWRWSLLVASTLRRPAAYQPLGLEVVDVEVIPNFSGSPDRIQAWFIFGTADEASAAALRRDVIAGHAQRLLASAGFPPEALRSLSIDFTSNPEIEAAGGRFAYFR